MAALEAKTAFHYFIVLEPRFFFCPFLVFHVIMHGCSFGLPCSSVLIVPMFFSSTPKQKKSRHQRTTGHKMHICKYQTFAAAATKSALQGSQSAAPAMKSALRGPQSAELLPLPRNLGFKVQCCPCHEVCNKIHKVLRLPQNLHFRVHKVLACHEICTSRFTKYRACHETCTSRSTKYTPAMKSVHQDSHAQPCQGDSKDNIKMSKRSSRSRLPPISDNI